MGQKKSVNKDTIDNDVVDKFSDMLKNIQAHYMQLTIATSKDEDDTWTANGTMQVGSSLDKEHWGEVAMSVKGYDVNSDSALATVMVSLNNFINSPEFVVEMGTRMLKSMSEEKNTPDIMTP